MYKYLFSPFMTSFLWDAVLIFVYMCVHVHVGVCVYVCVCVCARTRACARVSVSVGVQRFSRCVLTESLTFFITSCWAVCGPAINARSVLGSVWCCQSLSGKGLYLSRRCGDPGSGCQPQKNGPNESKGVKRCNWRCWMQNCWWTLTVLSKRRLHSSGFQASCG